MLCAVYKSLRQFDYYVYVRAESALSELPKGLQQLMGEMYKVIEIELHPQRKLAQADVEDVMRQIDASGYYLQMPQSRNKDRQLDA